MTVFRVSLVEVYRRFRGAYWHHLGPETSVYFYQTTQRNSLEDSHLNIRRRENLKSHFLLFIRFPSFLSTNETWGCAHLLLHPTTES
jgi:hypothetical protein